MLMPWNVHRLCQPDLPGNRIVSGAQENNAGELFMVVKTEHLHIQLLCRAR